MMSKDVEIKVPCCNMEVRAIQPGESKREGQVLGGAIVIVPGEALEEVKAVLEKYKPQKEALHQAILKKATVQEP
jgi:ribosomal protein L16/L10AE